MKKQTCWVYCPVCRNELTSDDESNWHEEMGLVVYGCAGCGAVSKWDFDAQVPLLISHAAQQADSADPLQAVDDGENSEHAGG